MSAKAGTLPAMPVSKPLTASAAALQRVSAFEQHAAAATKQASPGNCTPDRQHMQHTAVYPLLLRSQHTQIGLCVLPAKSAARSFGRSATGRQAVARKRSHALLCALAQQTASQHVAWSLNIQMHCRCTCHLKLGQQRNNVRRWRHLWACGKCITAQPSSAKSVALLPEQLS